MSKEAMKLALDALGEIEWSNNSQWQSDRAKVAITALREALAEQPAQQQEPRGRKEHYASADNYGAAYETSASAPFTDGDPNDGY